MPFSEEKQAAMRAAFRADLAGRLTEIEGLVERLQADRISPQEAASLALAHLHDIKGCATPYGFPQVTQLARDYEAQLLRPAVSRGELLSVLETATGVLRQFTV